MRRAIAETRVALARGRALFGWMAGRVVGTGVHFFLRGSVVRRAAEGGGAGKLMVDRGEGSFWGNFSEG